MCVPFRLPSSIHLFRGWPTSPVCISCPAQYHDGIWPTEWQVSYTQERMASYSGRSRICSASEVGDGGTGRLTVTTRICTGQKGVIIYLETSDCETSDETVSLKNTPLSSSRRQRVWCVRFVQAPLLFVEMQFASSVQIRFPLELLLDQSVPPLCSPAWKSFLPAFVRGSEYFGNVRRV